MEEGDRVISMTILRHVDSQRRGARGLSEARQCGASWRRGGCGRADDEADAEEASADAIELGEKRYVEMSALEQFVLTVSEKGMGKRTSSYEYRITNRGGKGIVAMGILEGKKGAKTIRKKTGKLVASFPVEESDQIMLVTDRRSVDPHPRRRYADRQPILAGRDRVRHRG